MHSYIHSFILRLHGCPLCISQNHISTTLTTVAACLPECTERLYQTDRPQTQRQNGTNIQTPEPHYSRIARSCACPSSTLFCGVDHLIHSFNLVPRTSTQTKLVELRIEIVAGPSIQQKKNMSMEVMAILTAPRAMYSGNHASNPIRLSNLFCATTHGSATNAVMSPVSSRISINTELNPCDAMNFPNVVGNVSPS